MTRTTPFLRITLQLRQIFLTEASTFIAASPSFGLIGLHWPAAISLCRFLLHPEHDTTASQIVRRHLKRNLVTREDTDIVHPHFPGDVSEYYMSIFQFHPEGRIREIVNDLPLHLNYVFLRHSSG